MSKRESIARYDYIIRKLRIKEASFSEINNYLRLNSEVQGSDFTISKRTFQRDLNDIRSLYNIDIRYDSSLKVYYICEENQSEASRRIMESFDILNAFNMGEKLSDYLHFEQRLPRGTVNMATLLDAIRNRERITFSYRSFGDGIETVRTAEPLGLKEFRNRWYVLATDTKDHIIKSFALDRLHNLMVTGVKFVRDIGFDMNRFYNHCYGITHPMHTQPEEIVLKFEPRQSQYITTLPLHHSQQIVTSDETGTVIKLYMYVTHDFIMELLSMGSNVEVQRPESLRNTIRDTMREALERYED